MEIIKINDIDITDKIVSFQSYDEINSDCIIGNTISTQIKLKIRDTDGSISKIIDSEIIVGNKTYIIYEKPKKWTKEISLVLYDKMIKFNSPYKTKLDEYATISQQLDEMVVLSGEVIDKTTLSDDVLNKVSAWYDSTTIMRSYIGLIAQCDGKNAFIEDDKVVFKRVATALHGCTFCSDYELNEQVTYTRVCFDNGIVNPIEEGTTEGHTLYVSPNNYYIDATDIHRIYEMYKGLSFYSFKKFKTYEIPGFKLTDLVEYDGFKILPISNKCIVNGGIALNSFELSGNINIKNKDAIIVKENPLVRIKLVQAEIDQLNGAYKVISKDVSENSSKITQLELNNEKFQTSVKEVETKVEEINKRVTVISISSQYGVSPNKETEPTNWLDERPSLIEGQYLWMREKYTYSDKTVKYDGIRMITSENGADGKGIEDVVLYYAVSKSNTVAPTSGYQTAIPERPSSYYLWQYEKIKYTDGTSKETEPMCVTGDKGDMGSAGKTSYFHIKYSSVSNPTTSDQMTETPSTYIGTYVDFVQADSTDPTKYTWAQFKGSQGAKGDQGIPGKDGASGKTSYLHIAYANSADGKTGFSVSDSTNKLYIGQYTDFVQSDSTDPTKYNWTKIKGDTGATGATGPAGKGIKSTVITYQAGASGTSIPTGSWTSGIPSVSQGQYLWSRTIITYTDNTTSTSYSVAYIPKNGTNGSDGAQGPAGAPGATGTGVNSIVQQYYLSTSKTTQTGGSWVTSMPTWSSGKYLWTRYQINYKNPTSTSYTSPICDSSWEAVNEVEVGGRNLVLKSGQEQTTKAYNFQPYYLSPYSSDKVDISGNPILEEGETYTISCKMKVAKGTNVEWVGFYWTGSVRITTWTPVFDEDHIYTYTFKANHGNDNNKKGILYAYVGPSEATRSNSTLYWVKIEKGNKATDWTPAPEDLQEDITNAVEQSKAEVKQDYTSLINATSKQLELMVKKLQQITEDNATSIISISNQLQITSEMAQFVKTTTEQLQNIVDGKVSSAEIREWARFDGAQLELGASNSPFKAILSNTELAFYQGSNKVTWITNNELHVMRAVIVKEIGVGDWRVTHEKGVGLIFRKV